MATEKRLIDANASIEELKKAYCTDCDSYGGVRCGSCWVDDAIEWMEDTPTEKGRKKMKMKVMLDPGAIMPTRAHETDAGLDLYSTVDGYVFCKDGICENSLCIDTGVHVEIPAGYVGMIKSKSGLNVKQGITSEGVIDAGYTGSIVVKLYNSSTESVMIRRGQKISQLVLLPIITPELELVDSLEDTERGSGGFGSTGEF